MSHDSSSLLYTAATESLVADQSSVNVYEKMITFAIGLAADQPAFAKEIHETEKQIKKDFEIKSMPSPWRSAKSVVSTAMSLGISLVDDNMVMRGKTALQMAIKAKKTEGKTEKDYEYYMNKICSVVNSIDDPGMKSDVIHGLKILYM